VSWWALPNTRVQRTRVPRFARVRSPLTRRPLGRRSLPGRHLVWLIGPVWLMTACDPGVHYRPHSWAQVAEYRWRDTPLAGVALETSGTGGLIGSTALAPEFTITNRSSWPVVLSSGLLGTRAGRYCSKPIRPEDEEWYTIGPGDTKRVTLFFFLPRPLSRVLSDPVVLTVDLSQGDAVYAIAVPLIRD
jgi:hypothetical protein